jgi:hypothetical protein
MMAWRQRRLCAVAVLLCLPAGLGACGDDDTETATTPLSEWVDEFNRHCRDTEDVDRAFADMRALPLPDEKADEAAALLEGIAADQDESLNDTTRAELDKRTYAAGAALGVSEECLGPEPVG